MVISVPMQSPVAAKLQDRVSALFRVRKYVSTFQLSLPSRGINFKVIALWYQCLLIVQLVRVGASRYFAALK